MFVPPFSRFFAVQQQEVWFLQSSFPVSFPSHPVLIFSRDEFDAFLQADLTDHHVGTEGPEVKIAKSLDQVTLSTEDMSTNKMATENNDTTTEDPLVDLFKELRRFLKEPRLVELLDAAWARDSLATLKIIFHARSIHLGKSSRKLFYSVAGWLAKNHPLTLAWNLQWLIRPVIEKPENAEADVCNGRAHGYWKDLLNILALAANGKLDPLASSHDVLNIGGWKARDINCPGNDREAAKRKRREVSDKCHETAIRLFQDDATYRVLHLTVARLFAEQLQRDLAALHGTRQTALRAHLEVVERDISAGTFENIHYDRLPSIAVKTYAALFIVKDEAHFLDYLNKFVLSDAKISGATLLPSTLVNIVQWMKTGTSRVKGAKISGPNEINARVADAQWKMLVQRVRESGVLDNSIAVCGAFGSLQHVLRDKTDPMSSSIGLSLLMSEVASPPFNRLFIYFSNQPEVVSVPIHLRLFEKVRQIMLSNWNRKPDFVAIFEKLILPLAKEKGLRQEDMVKRVFVFNDEPFNKAQNTTVDWNSSYMRVEQAYRAAGYEMPKLIY